MASKRKKSSKAKAPAKTKSARVITIIKKHKAIKAKISGLTMSH